MAVEDSGARSARREPRPAAWDDEDERWLEGERAAWAARLRDLPVEDSHQALERLRVERIELLGDDAHRVLRRAEVAAGAGIISLGGGELRVGERPAGRKRSGAFYTPPDLARPTVERALGPLVRRRDGRPRTPEEVLGLRVCDPSCGAGSFLLPAFEFLTAALERSVAEHGCGAAPGSPQERRRSIARECLFGVDRDAAAVAGARRVLALASGVDPDELALRVGDALVGRLAESDRGLPLRALERDGGDERDEGPTRRRRARALSDFRARIKRGERRGQARLPAPRDEREEADRWVAWWFWPTSELEQAPLADGSVCDPKRSADVVRRLTAELRPFHWWIEFPEVERRGGFDAIVGNPPWETVKGPAADFFEALEPRYEGLGAPESRRRRRALFDERPELERAWIDRRERTKAYANWFARVSEGSGERPFRFRGRGDLNGHKLFLELSWALLREGGRMGLVLPGSLVSDLGTRELRRLLFERCRWECWWGFDNRDGIFPIHRSLRFGALVAERGGPTEQVQVAFAEVALDAWSDPRTLGTSYTRALVEATSPRASAFLELADDEERALLERIAAAGRPLADSGWGASFSTELHTSHDAALFERRERLESVGARQAEDGAWLEADWRPASDPGGERRIVSADGAWWAETESVRARHLPVLQGAMIAVHDANAARHVGGHGRDARFEPQGGDAPLPRPQYLANHATLADRERLRPGLKLVHRRIAPATNARTLVVAPAGRWPALDSLFLYTIDGSPRERVLETLALTALLGSFVVDWQVRRRAGGVNLSQYVVEELFVPPRERLGAAVDELARLAARVGLGRAVRSSLDAEERAVVDQLVAVWPESSSERRTSLVELEQVVAGCFALEPRDLQTIFADCAHPAERLGRRSFTARLPARGFWRVDRELPAEQRTTTRALSGFSGRRVPAPGTPS